MSTGERGGRPTQGRTDLRDRRVELDRFLVTRIAALRDHLRREDP